jgi:hypothetical protein
MQALIVAGRTLMADLLRSRRTPHAETARSAAERHLPGWRGEVDLAEALVEVEVIEEHARTGAYPMLDRIAATRLGEGPLPAEDVPWMIMNVLWNAVTYTGAYAVWSLMSTIPVTKRLGCGLLWLSRMLARREDLFFDAEMRLEAAMLEELERLMEDRSNEDREPVPVIQAADFRAETFERLYKDKSPVVIRGLGKGTVAARTWSPDYFAEKYGRTLVEVRDSPRERVGTNADYNAADFVSMPLGEYIRGMRTGASQVYLGAMSEIFGQHPELMDDLEIDALSELLGVKVIRPEIFMGLSRNHTPWHCAGIDNYFLQVSGEKEWHFIDPAYTAGLYLKASAMVFGAPGLFSNVVPGDDRLFPLFKRTPQYVARLVPGDFLYNPAYGWHEVANIGETIGCALRVVAEGGFGHFLFLDKFLLATSFLNPAMIIPTGAPLTGRCPTWTPPAGHPSSSTASARAGTRRRPPRTAWTAATSGWSTASPTWRRSTRAPRGPGSRRTTASGASSARAGSGSRRSSRSMSRCAGWATPSWRCTCPRSACARASSCCRRRRRGITSICVSRSRWRTRRSSAWWGPSCQASSPGSSREGSSPSTRTTWPRTS